MKSTRLAWIFVAIRTARYSKYLTRGRTFSLSLAISPCRSICPSSFLPTQPITTLPCAVRYVRETKLATSKPCVATGLAYTPYGGEVLYIEATRYPGKGNVILTGHIGEVMKESVQAALSLVRTRANEIGAKPEEFRDNDIHVHVPAGAVPKDGPSAGIAMFTALASLFSNTPVRPDVAMTGEITLRGLVLPI